MSNLNTVSVKPTALVNAYLVIRAERADLAKKEAELKTKQDLLGGMIMDKMRELDMSAFTSNGYTVYQSTLTTASVKDRAAFLAFVQENDLFDLVDLRASKDAVVNWMNDNPWPQQDGTEVPTPVPGVEINAIARVNVRKAG
jgi:hypothetical protein